MAIKYGQKKCQSDKKIYGNFPSMEYEQKFNEILAFSFQNFFWCAHNTMPLKIPQIFFLA